MIQQPAVPGLFVARYLVKLVHTGSHSGKRSDGEPRRNNETLRGVYPEPGRRARNDLYQQLGWRSTKSQPVQLLSSKVPPVSLREKGARGMRDEGYAR